MALKREATSSMFEQLKNTAGTEQTKSTVPEPPEKSAKKEVPKAKKESSAKKDAPVKEIADEKVNKQVEQNPAEKKPAEKKEPVKIENNAERESKTTVKAYDFGQAKERELKKIRKQFVLTPTHAKWLKETAELNNISENKVIENMINMMMNS